MAVQAWTVVLVKDFDHAKTRLVPVLGAEARRDLARHCAERALDAVAGSPHVLVVAGGDEAASLAARMGAEVLRERRPRGQNPAARAGIARAVERGAGAVLLLSSDLPLVTRAAVATLLDHGDGIEGDCAVAAPATGRGGTNALYLRPPGVLGLHFGEGSLAAFAADARRRGVRFEEHRSDALALDLDVPGDLETLALQGARA